jgi:hypothetical protein
MNDNNYNQDGGSEEYSASLKIDSRVSGLYEDQLGDNVVESHVVKMLEQEIFKIFEASPYHEKYKMLRKIDKGDSIKMFYYFKTSLDKYKTFSSSEIFMAFAEFFQVNYEQLYSEISVLDKESLLKELNEKYQLNSKIKTKKLF